MTSEFEAPLFELRRETSRESEERGEASARDDRRGPEAYVGVR